jgi:hypothetical protein
MWISYWFYRRKKKFQLSPQTLAQGRENRGQGDLAFTVPRFPHLLIKVSQSE